MIKIGNIASLLAEACFRPVDTQMQKYFSTPLYRVNISIPKFYVEEKAHLRSIYNHMPKTAFHLIEVQNMISDSPKLRAFSSRSKTRRHAKNSCQARKALRLLPQESTESLVHEIAQVPFFVTSHLHNRVQGDRSLLAAINIR